jgi:acyl-CoA reductase-like NAD-dependent aldehyde dehydrogenase
LLKVFNPSNGTLIAELKPDTPQIIALKVRTAKKAQPAWKSTDIRERIKVISKFKDLLNAQKNDLSKLLTLEVGKPIKQSRSEIEGAIGRIDFFLENAESTLKDQEVFKDPISGFREVLSRDPLGVIANISAWNYPYLVGVNVFVPALLAGNAVLYKPSEFASLTGLKITDLLHKSGVSESIFSPIIGDGKVGEELLNQNIDGVFFTGSYKTGLAISNALSGRLIKLQLELGGKDPVYVTEDVDPKIAAASIADGTFYNCGQGCCSIERIYVHEKIYDSFLAHFLQEVASFKIGLPEDEETYLGPLTRKVHQDFLMGQVNDAIKKGARLEMGGEKIKDFSDYYFAPTVITNVNHEMDLMSEETFGPLVGIQKVSSDEKAVTLMSDTSYGLTAGVYCRDERRARRLLDQVDSGTSYWNCCDRVSPRLPWAGRNHSGIGLTLGTDGILTFTKTRSWHLRPQN